MVISTDGSSITVNLLNKQKQQDFIDGKVNIRSFAN